MTLGQRLREALARADLSAEAMGRRLGVSGAAVRKWTYGKNEPDIGTLRAFARESGASLLWLLEGDQAPPALSDWAVAFADLVARGVDPAAAVAEVSGGAASLSGAEGQLLSGAGAGRVPRLSWPSWRAAGRRWTR